MKERRNKLLAVGLLGAVLSAISVPVVAQASDADDNFDKLRIVLSDNASDNRKKCAYLAIDNNGKPVIYPSPRKNRTGHYTSLAKMSEIDVRQLWNARPDNKQKEEYIVKFVGYTGKWSTYIVNMRFSNNQCSSFKVTGPGVIFQDWISTKVIPEPSKYPLLTIGCIEGPKDSGCEMANYIP